MTALNKDTLSKLVLAAIILFIIYRLIVVSRHAEKYAAYDNNGDIAPWTTTAAAMAPYAKKKNKQRKKKNKKKAVTFATPTPVASISANLLPKDTQMKNQWSLYAPKPEQLQSNNFLDARSNLLGENTIGGSLRNANHSLRKDPPIQRIPNATIWNNATIEASDTWRRALD